MELSKACHPDVLKPYADVSIIREFTSLFPAYKPDDVYNEEFVVVMMFVSENRRTMEFEERKSFLRNQIEN